MKVHILKSRIISITRNSPFNYRPQLYTRRMTILCSPIIHFVVGVVGVGRRIDVNGDSEGNFSLVAWKSADPITGKAGYSAWPIAYFVNKPDSQLTVSSRYLVHIAQGVSSGVQYLYRIMFRYIWFFIRISNVLMKRLPQCEFDWATVSQTLASFTKSMMKTHYVQLRLSGYGSFELVSLVASTWKMFSVQKPGVDVLESCLLFFFLIPSAR